LPLDHRLFSVAETIRNPGMGTENVAPLLYSLVRMVRATAVLEVGMGYSTPFLAMALRDNIRENEEDLSILAKSLRSPAEEARVGLLASSPHIGNYAPKLHVIDDYSLPGSTAHGVQRALVDLDLASLVVEHHGDFRGRSATLPEGTKFDLVWFDCGGPRELFDFVREYWALVNPREGMLVYHLGYWGLPMKGHAPMIVAASPMTNELKRLQAELGEDAPFEVMSLLEPHKVHQGSVTMVRRLSEISSTREQSCDQEFASLRIDVGPFPSDVFREVCEGGSEAK
jgi:hypothetical protein